MQSSHSSQIEFLHIKAWVIDAIRLFFKEHDFLEVFTDSLSCSPDPEPSIELFKAQQKLPDGTEKTLFLAPSPEFEIKKLLSKGVGNCFQICRCFRNNEPVAPLHAPEFLMLEWYRVEADYLDIMQDCQQLLSFVVRYVEQKKHNPKLPIWELPDSAEVVLTYQGNSIEIGSSLDEWQVLSVSSAFEQYAHINQTQLLDEKLFKQALKDKGYQFDEQTTFQELFDQVFVQEIQAHLGFDRPAIVYEYLSDQAALAKLKNEDPRFAERFEWYIAGIELGNAFSELTDWQQQQDRLQQNLKFRQQNNQDIPQLDEEFIEALQVGIPRTGGIAVGVDRLVMLLSGKDSIRYL